VGLVLGAARDVVGRAGGGQVARLDAGLPEHAEVEVGEHVREAQGVIVVARGCSDAVLIDLEDRRAALAEPALARLAVDDVVAFPAQVGVEFRHAHEDLPRRLLLRVAFDQRHGVVDRVQQVVQLLHRPGRAPANVGGDLDHLPLHLGLADLHLVEGGVKNREKVHPGSERVDLARRAACDGVQATAERRAQEAPQRVVGDGVDHDVPRRLLAPVPARHYWLGVAAYVLRLAAHDAVAGHALLANQAAEVVADGLVETKPAASVAIEMVIRME